MQPENKNQDRKPKASSGANLVDGTFLLLVAAKGLGGLIELASGILLIVISSSQLDRLLAPLSHVGLGIDHVSSGAKLFLVIYFGLRGTIRMGLAVSLILEKLWAYPAAIVLLGIAVGYQTWLMASGHYSHALLLLTLLDMVIVALTWFEYRKLRQGGHIHRPHL